MTASATSPAHGSSGRAETDSTAYTQLPSTTQPARLPDRATTSGWTPSRSLSAATPAMRPASEHGRAAETTASAAKWDPRDLFVTDEESAPVQARNNGAVAVVDVQLPRELQRASSVYEASSAERGGWPVLSSAMLHRPTPDHPTTDGVEPAPGWASGGAPPTGADKAATSAGSSSHGSGAPLTASETAKASVVGETLAMDGTSTSSRAPVTATTPAVSSTASGAQSSVSSTKPSQSFSPVTNTGAWGAPEVTRGPVTGNSGWGAPSTDGPTKASGWNTAPASSTTSGWNAAPASSKTASSGSTQAHAPTRPPAAATPASSGGWNARSSSTSSASSWTGSRTHDPPHTTSTTATTATSGWRAPTATTTIKASATPATGTIPTPAPATSGWGAPSHTASSTRTPAPAADSAASRSGWSPGPVKAVASSAQPAPASNVASTKPTPSSGWDLSPDRPVVARSVGGWGAPTAAPSTQRSVGGWGADVKKDVSSDASRGSGRGQSAPRSDSTGRRDDGASWNVSRRYDDGRNNGGRGNAGRGRYGSSVPSSSSNDHRSHDRRSQPRDSAGRGGRGGHYGSRGSDNGRSPSRASSRDSSSYGNAGRSGGRAPSSQPERRGRSRSKSRHRDANAFDAKRFKPESSYAAPPHDDPPSFEFGGGESPRRPPPRLAEINGPPSPPPYPRTPIVARRASPVPIMPGSEWFFAVLLGKKMVQCRAMATGLPFTRQPLPQEVNVSQLPKLKLFETFMHLEAKSECPHWIYEMLPLSPTDGVPYEELKTYLLRRRDEPVAGMALDIPRYKIIVLPPGGEARLLGYIGHNLIAVIRRNKLKK